jgi:hypothetical protein
MRNLVPCLVAALSPLAPLPAFAQSSLGLSFAEASFGLTSSAGGETLSGRLSGDWRITANHGVQLDLGLRQGSGGLVGQVDGHLYMSPREDRKYGFFVSLADLDERSGVIGMAGVEGMIEIAPGTLIEGRAGAGMAQPGGMDFITVSAGLRHALSDSLSLDAGITVTEFDEAGFSAIGTQTGLGVTWESASSPLSLSARIEGDRLSGYGSETRVGLSLTYAFGPEGGARRGVGARAFTAPQPMLSLIDRGLF